MDSATIESCVRGHHIYKANWNPCEGEELFCCKEENNSHDPYAVVVMKGNVIVGHVLRKISAACSLFLEKEDTTITCTITGKQRYSTELPQGGLEVPCVLNFRGRVKDVGKIVKLLWPAGTSGSGLDPPPSKKSKMDTSDDLDPKAKRPGPCDHEHNGGLLSQDDKRIILDGKWLSDTHVNVAQQLLKKQFPNLLGLFSTLLLSKLKNPIPAGASTLQILHIRGNHCIVASTIGCQPGEVRLFDSLYKSIDTTTMALVSLVFGKDVSVSLEPSQQQQGGSDCGVFAIANCTALAHVITPLFNQEKMRQHLIQRFENAELSPFPA